MKANKQHFKMQDHIKELPIFLFPDGAVEPEMVAGTNEF